MTQEILIVLGVVAVIVIVLLSNWIGFCVCIRNNVLKRRAMVREWAAKQAAQRRFEEGMRALVSREVNRRVQRKIDAQNRRANETQNPNRQVSHE